MSLRYKAGDDVRAGTTFGPGMTKQEFAKESDLNHIMKRFTQTGVMPAVFNEQVPVFADCVGVGDFAEATRRVKAAEEAFMELPAEIRTRFNNQPVQLIEFLQNPENRPEAEKLGLVEPKKVEAPVAPPAAPVPTP